MTCSAITDNLAVKCLFTKYSILCGCGVSRCGQCKPHGACLCVMFTVYEPELRLVRRHETCFQSSLITGVFRETLGAPLLPDLWGLWQMGGRSGGSSSGSICWRLHCWQSIVGRHCCLRRLRSRLFKQLLQFNENLLANPRTLDWMAYHLPRRFHVQFLELSPQELIKGCCILCKRDLVSKHLSELTLKTSSVLAESLCSGLCFNIHL